LHCRNCDCKQESGDKKKKKTDDKPKESKGDDEELALFGDKKKTKEKKDKKDEEPEEIRSEVPEKKSKKTKKDDDSYDEVLDEKVKKEKKSKRPMPVACEIVEVSPIPKKDKLRLCKIRVAEDGDLLSVVTNASNVGIGVKCIVALAGVMIAHGVEVKVGKVGGVKSEGMFCGPVQMGWVIPPLSNK
jgi:tRNA-binding EMAP/Myf-like protein